MIRLAGISVIGIILFAVVKKYAPEYSVLVEIGSIVLVIWIAFPYICDVIDFYYEYIGASGVDGDYLKIVVKALGIGLITQFCSDICKDSGEGALASKVELCGKAVMLAMALPIAKAVLEFAYSVINMK